MEGSTAQDSGRISLSEGCILPVCIIRNCRGGNVSLLSTWHGARAVCLSTELLGQPHAETCHTVVE